MNGKRKELTEKPRCDGVVFFGTLEDGLRKRQRVAHHGPVEAVLRHDGAPAPALLCLAPFRTSVLEPHLGGQQNAYIILMLFTYR